MTNNFGSDDEEEAPDFIGLEEAVSVAVERPEEQLQPYEMVHCPFTSNIHCVPATLIECICCPPLAFSCIDTLEDAVAYKRLTDGVCRLTTGQWIR